MSSYYVNKNPQPNGDHEVHIKLCGRLPEDGNRVYLGEHYTCREAVREAKRHYSQVNGCFYCSRPCHTG